MDFINKFKKSKILRITINRLHYARKPVTLENVINMMVLIRNYCLEHKLTYDEYERLICR